MLLLLLQCTVSCCCSNTATINKLKWSFTSKKLLQTRHVVLYRISYVYRFDNIIQYRLSAKSHIGATLMCTHPNLLVQYVEICRLHKVTPTYRKHIFLSTHLRTTTPNDDINLSFIHLPLCSTYNASQVYKMYVAIGLQLSFN